MDPNLSLLAAYPGDYRMELIKVLYNALNLEAEGISVWSGIKSKTNLHKLVVSKGAKPYTGKFVSKDDLTFEPRVLSVEKAQRDISIEPSKYRQTFMEKLRGAGENSENYNIPFAQHMWNEVLQELATEINLETVFHGVGAAGFAAYSAGTAYSVGDLIKYTQAGELRYFRCVTATTAGQNPDTHAAKWEWAGARAIAVGLGKIIVDEIAASKVTPVATGAVSNTNAYEKFTQVFRSHLEPVKMGKHGKVITHCSMTDYENLTDDYENKITKQFEEIDGVLYLAKTNRVNIIQPVSWLSGSRRLVSSLKGNLVAGTDQLNDMNVINTIKQMYSIDAGITFMIGFNIQDLAGLRVNDQA